MKHKIFIAIHFLIMSVNVYAQTNILSVEAYYSAPHEITIEMENLTNKEMVALIDRGSYVNFYKETGQYKSKQLVNHLLMATDSLNILANIPARGKYVTKYQVKDTNWTKLYLTMEYTLSFISPPANSKWQLYSKEMNILPYDQQRPSAQQSIKKRLSGEYVYTKPDLCHNFPEEKKS